MLTLHPHVKVKLDKGAYMPERAHETDAGADIATPVDVMIWPHSSVIIKTGIHVELPPNTRGDIVAKSGLNINHNILSFGLIDEGYSGEICIKLYNLGEQYVRLDKGTKVSQLVISHVCYATFEEVDEIRSGERGDDGFGSTGDKISGGPRL